MLSGTNNAEDIRIKNSQSGQTDISEKEISGSPVLDALRSHMEKWYPSEQGAENMVPVSDEDMA